MQYVHEMKLPEVDVLSREFAEDIFGHYEKVVKEHWLAQSPVGYLVLGYQEMKDMLTMDDVLVPGNRETTKLLGAEGTSFAEFNDNFMLALSGDDHRRVRGLAAATFTPKSADRARAMMREIFENQLDQWLPKGKFDFAQFAAPYPITVMTRLIGARSEDVPEFIGLLERINSSFGDMVQNMPEICAAIDALMDYFGKLIDDRRQINVPDRKKDLLDQLLEARDGEDRLSDKELNNLLGVLYLAGYDTSKNLLTLIMNLLLDNPDMWARVESEPGFAAKVIDEALRYSTVVTVVRVANEEFTYKGVTFPAGSRVLLPTTFAGRDDKVFKDASTFNPDRVHEEKSFAFGWGSHICIGMFIAKAQIQEALPILAARMKNPRRDGEVVWRDFMAITGLKSLPIAFDAT